MFNDHNHIKFLNIKKINWLNITSEFKNESFISSRPLGCYENDLDLMIVLKHIKVNMEL